MHGSPARNSLEFYIELRGQVRGQGQINLWRKAGINQGRLAARAQPLFMDETWGARM